MKIYFISPIGYITPDLYSSFVKTFEEQGHIIASDVKEADCVFFDIHTRHAPYDWDVLQIVLDKKIPVCVFDFWDYGAMAKDTWFGFNLKNLQRNNDWSDFIMVAKERCKVIYFIRKMDKKLSFPQECYPIELIQYSDHVFQEVTKEELFRRPNDICFIGNISPTRLNITNALKDYFKCDFVLGQERIPHGQWLDRHRNSKLFLEACGGGFGSERPYQLIYLSTQLRIDNNQLIFNDWTDGINCIKVEEHPTNVDYILEVLNDKDRLYEIYLNGISHMKKYFSAEARSLYVLQKMKENRIC